MDNDNMDKENGMRRSEKNLQNNLQVIIFQVQYLHVEYINKIDGFMKEEKFYQYHVLI